MKISYHWLKKYLPGLPSPEKAACMLTQLGLEVNKLTPFQLFPPDLIIGHILTCSDHPQADRLKKATVDIGAPSPLNIVCGAKNVASGQKVIVAPVGTILHLPKGEPLKIKKVKIRGEVSEGMICAEEELGLAKTQEGILVIETRHQPGTPAAVYFNAPPDTILDIDLTPNRADAFSHIGVARELAALMQKDLEEPLLQPLVPVDMLGLQIIVESPMTCPRYVAAIMNNVQLAPSPVWLQKRLKAIGLTPINNVVDITNFVMHEFGQPLHAFDYDKLASKRIILKKLPAQTPFIGLDGISRTLTGDELMICDKARPLAMAGIIGAESSKINTTTQTILLESACFDASTIAKAARHHDLHTEASFRFERGTDPELPRIALQRAINLLQKVTHGNLASDVIEYYPHEINPIHIPITYAYIHNMIGFSLAPPLIHDLLTKLDIVVEDITPEGFTAVVPPYRVDVTRPADILEEILRLYGYNNLPEQIDPGSPYLMPALPYEKCLTYKQHISNFLAAQGYLQIITNPITNSTFANFDPTLDTRQTVHLANPLNEHLDSLRQTLLFSGLEVVSHNLNHGQSNLRLFEIGRIYNRDQEAERLGIWLVGNREEANWMRAPEKITLQDLYAIVHLLLQHAGLTDWQTTPLQSQLYHASLTLYKNDEPLLEMGSVHGDLLKKMNIPLPVLFAQIDIHALFDHSHRQHVYTPITKCPPIRRDLSIAVDMPITFEQIRTIIQAQNILQIQTFYLTDYYTGPAIETNKKSYTLRFVLQDTKKTLKDEHANRLIEQLMNMLNKKLGATMRE